MPSWSHFYPSSKPTLDLFFSLYFDGHFNPKTYYHYFSTDLYHHFLLLLLIIILIPIYIFNTSSLMQMFRPQFENSSSWMPKSTLSTSLSVGHYWLHWMSLSVWLYPTILTLLSITLWISLFPDLLYMGPLLMFFTHESISKLTISSHC